MFSPNNAWSGTRSDNLKFYGSEKSIAVIIQNYLDSFVIPLNLPLEIMPELAVTNIRPDILVLTTLNSILVGVVEVKKPEKFILEKPTVIGELFDQTKLIQLFYGTGPALGILTTGEQFVVCWFPEDDEVFSAAPKQDLLVDSSPVNATGGKKSGSPPGNTPSQKKGPNYISTEDEKEFRTKVPQQPLVEPVTFDRKLFCTKTIDGTADQMYLGQVIATCLTRMSHARELYYPPPSQFRHLFRFHRGPLKKITWVSFDSSVIANIPFDKFPNKNVNSLLALEDLGRGSNGKAWLTTTETFKAICVLKFDNENNESKLITEASYWRKLYDSSISGMVAVDTWSGASALMMPHFATIQEGDRESYREKIVQLLERIHSLGCYHDDVRWRNMGCYKKGSKECDDLLPILFDLIHVKEFEREVEFHSREWIGEGLKNLFPASPPSEPAREGVNRGEKKLFEQNDDGDEDGICEKENMPLSGKAQKQSADDNAPAPQLGAYALVADFTSLTIGADNPSTAVVGVVTRGAVAAAAVGNFERRRRRRRGKIRK